MCVCVYVPCKLTNFPPSFSTHHIGLSVVLVMKVLPPMYGGPFGHVHEVMLEDEVPPGRLEHAEMAKVMLRPTCLGLEQERFQIVKDTKQLEKCRFGAISANARPLV